MIKYVLFGLIAYGYVALSTCHAKALAASAGFSGILASAFTRLACNSASEQHEGKTTMNFKQIMKRNETIARNAGKLGDDIQEHLVKLATFCFANSGNVTPAADFAKRMREAGTARSNAIDLWLRDFAAVKFGKDDEPAKLNKKLFKAVMADDASFQEHMKVASATDWRTYSKEPKVNLDFDFNAALEAILKRYDSKVAEHGDKLNVKNADKLEAIKALIA